MFKITEERLKELVFQSTYLPENSRGRISTQFEYEKGSVVVGRNGNDFYVQIYAPITTASDYAREAKGVKTEEDLLTLCRLIDG